MAADSAATVPLPLLRAWRRAAAAWSLDEKAAALDRIAVALHNAAQHTPFTTTEWQDLEQAQVDARVMREAVVDGRA